MSKRTLLIGAVLLALVGLALWFVLRGQGSDPKAEADGPDQAEQRKALIAKKHAARDERKLEMGTPRTVTGRVTRKEDGQGVPGAVVLLTRKAVSQGATSEPGYPPAPLRAVTDAGGGFSLGNVTPGRYVVSATARGYLPGQSNDVRVLAKDEQATIELVLEQGGHSLRGVVTDVSGGPIEDVLISVNDQGSGNLFGVRFAPPATLTDEEGRYEVNLPNGAYVLTTYHPDYVATYRLTQVMDGPRVEDIQLTPGASIDGVVVARSTGDPIAGAIVTFQDSRNGNTGGFRANMSSDGRMVLTDDEGRFHLSGVQPGVAQVEARARGFGSRETLAVPVGIGESVTGIELVLDPAFTLSGFVVPKNDHEGAVEGVMVGAYTLSPPSLTVSAAPTDSDGYFEILGVPPGNYTVGALGEDMLPNVAGTSAVVDDQDVTDLLVEMDVGLRIRGRVEPPGPAKISLSVDTDQMGLGKILDLIVVAFAQATAGPDGEFDLGPIKSGSYTLVAQAPDGSRGELEVEVADVDLEGVTVKLLPQASVAGIVVDAQGNPQPGLAVQMQEIGGRSSSFSFSTGGAMGRGSPTGEDGSFTARGLSAGRYNVIVRDKKSRPIPWADDDTEMPSANVVEVAEGEQRTGLELRVQSRSGVLAGTVVDADGAPVVDAWVTASMEVGAQSFGRMMAGPKAPDPSQRERRRGVQPPDQGGDFQLPGFFAEPPVLTDDQGLFTITGLRSSVRYSVVAEGERGGARGRLEGLTADARGLVISLEAVTGLSGVVTAGGKPAERYTVKLEGGPSRRQKSVFSDKGTFSIDRIDAGEYTVAITSELGVARQEGVKVVADARARVEIELEEYGTIKGTLVDASTGDPIPGVMALVQSERGDFDPSQAMAMITGGGTKTGSDGTFLATKVSPGQGKVMFLDPQGAFAPGGGGGMVAAADYDMSPGETLDLGTIQGIPMQKVDEEEQGTLGLGVTVATYAKRPRPPGTKIDEEEPSELDEDETPRLWVNYVEVGGPADGEGVEPGDEVLSVDGRPLTELGPHAAGIQLEGPQIKIGQQVAVELMQDGSTRSVTIRAEAKKKKDEEPAAAAE